MKLFDNDIEGIFVERPNRFIIYCKIEQEVVKCHCPNTGRMKELLIPGVKLILEKSKNSSRKTLFTVVAVYKGELVVPITSVRANDIARDIVIPKLFPDSSIKSEVTYNSSRFDFFVESSNNKTFIEVKSCTYFIDDMAIFPDAPTSRGLKHIKELSLAVREGFDGVVLLIVFNPNSKKFVPNYKTDAEFAETLKSLSPIIKIIPYKIGINSRGELQELTNAVIPVDFNGVIND